MITIQRTLPSVVASIFFSLITLVACRLKEFVSLRTQKGVNFLEVCIISDVSTLMQTVFYVRRELYETGPLAEVKQFFSYAKVMPRSYKGCNCRSENHFQFVQTYDSVVRLCVNMTFACTNMECIHRVNGDHSVMVPVSTLLLYKLSVEHDEFKPFVGENGIECITREIAKMNWSRDVGLCLVFPIHGCDVTCVACGVSNMKQHPFLYSKCMTCEDTGLQIWLCASCVVSYFTDLMELLGHRRVMNTQLTIRDVPASPVSVQTISSSPPASPEVIQETPPRLRRTDTARAEDSPSPRLTRTRRLSFTPARNVVPRRAR